MERMANRLNWIKVASGRLRRSVATLQVGNQCWTLHMLGVIRLGLRRSFLSYCLWRLLGCGAAVHPMGWIQTGEFEIAICFVFSITDFSLHVIRNV